MMFVPVKGLNQVEHLVNISQITRITYGGKDNVHVYFTDGQQPLSIPDTEALLLKASLSSAAVK
jgi:hypothetical protein